MAHVHGNYYYIMVEGNSHVWQLTMHSKYSYTVEGSPHMSVMYGN